METPKSYQKDVYVLLDEGGNLTLPSFDTWITVLRKRRVSLTLICQSLSQIEARYGREKGVTIISNLCNQIYAPGMPLSTAQMLEKLLGTTTVAYRQPSRDNWEFQEKNRQYTARNLFTADELRRLEHPLFITGNQRATLLKNIKPYYKDFWLKRRARMSMPDLEFASLSPCEFLEV
ncbi:MAG: TraM recognition domain-containing protein [Flavobacteriaceae bacterium]|nr:MAG: TraM recognition domain-containing protein [Flavobacteriaceae bacterium]